VNTRFLLKDKEVQYEEENSLYPWFEGRKAK